MERRPVTPGASASAVINLHPSRPELPVWVKGYLPKCASATVAVPQMAADLLHRASRQRRAKPAVRSSV
jgi:hypothetical protein